MKRIVFVTLAVLATAVAGPAVHASSTDQIDGGCFLASVTTAGTQTAVIGDRSITTTGDAPPTPIGAVVTCYVTVNGVTAPGTTKTYGDLSGVRGVQAGADPIVLSTVPDDDVEVCTSVAFADNSTASRCDVVSNVPPSWVWDLLNQAGGPCGGDFVTQCLDVIACPILASMAGDYPGGVSIHPDGDVYVPDPLGLGLDPVYDCPPYVVVP